MAYRFGVERWAAYAPGLEDEAAWRAWAQQPVLPRGEGVPALSEMPAMQRRRLERLGRMALQVAYRCQPEAPADEPLVFGSRHGDIGRTHEMLEVLAREEPLSPTHFGLSTHNAIAAQYSIARHHTGNYSAVCAGERTAEAVIVEAAALLADGAPAVLAVMYDQPPPEAYAPYLAEPQAPYAWAWRLVPARADLPGLSLETAPPSARAVPTSLPGGLDVLRFFLSGERQWHVPGRDCDWHWQRHG